MRQAPLATHVLRTFARALGAHAFTLGRDVHFAPGAFDPASATGRRLLAHEAAHVALHRDRGPRLRMQQAAAASGVAATRLFPYHPGSSVVYRPTGAIRVGGRVLLVVGAVDSMQRIADAPAGVERVQTAIEEGGGWSGAMVGAALAEALGTAFVCTGPGPGAFACVAGFALGGGLAGDAAGRSVAQQLNTTVQGLQKLSEPGVLAKSMAWWHSRLTGSDAAKQLYEAREAETGEPPPFMP